MLSLPDGNSCRRSQSSLSVRSRALTTSSVLSACANVDTRFRRQVYSVDLEALRAKASGKKDSRPLATPSLQHVSTIRRTQGSLCLNDLLAIAGSEGTGTRASSVRSLSTALSFEGEVGGIQEDHWSTDTHTLDRASSQEGMNLSRLMPKPNMCKSKRLLNPLTQSIDNMHLVNSLPRSPQLQRTSRSPRFDIPSRRLTKCNLRSKTPKEFIK
uniref:Uncharacterized protein n=1 Tax=Strigamia maritima TaxID=126957 RepID=T1JG30_STRMM